MQNIIRIQPLRNIICNMEPDCHVTTSFSVLEYSFKWTLKKFSKIMPFVELESPHFYPEFKIPWSLSITSNRYRRSGMDINIHRHVNSDDVEAELELSCIDGGSNELIQTNNRHLRFKNNLASKSEILMSTEFKNLSNDVLELILLMKIYKKNSVQRDTSMEYCYLSTDEFQRDVERSLSSDLNMLYERHLYTDITLSMKEGSLKVHKAILAARSSVFATIFQHETAESTNNVIVIEDVKMAIMNEVVDYMYGRAKRDYDYDTAMEMYYAADKYDIKNLKKICGCILISQLTMENAYNVLQLADRHDDMWLTKQGIKFITFHSVQEK